MHETALIQTIAWGLGAALLFGIITQRLGLSPIVGYLLGGITVGPHTPGFVADPVLAQQLAEIGVILLMFGVGLHFHLKDLIAVQSIAIPGAVGQSLVATLLGMVVATAFGWTSGAGLVLGAAISVASTVVLLRVLTDSGLVSTPHGHVAIGWLVVEDIFTVLALVLLPVAATALTGGAPSPGTEQVPLLQTFAVAILKLAVMTVVILIGGGKVIPWILERIAQTRSRELFTLTVLAMALGLSVGSAKLFGASMALGAFLAGMVVGQSETHHQAAADALPMRDAFAVLFFVSVGMLFDPMFLLREPGLVLAVLAIVLVAKPVAALVIVMVLGYPVRTALTVALGLAQIGEFSFILGDMAVSLNVLPEKGRSVLVACALISITLNPLIFRLLPGIENWLRSHPRLWRLVNVRNKSYAEYEAAVPSAATEPEKIRAIVIGYGPVGRTLSRILNDFGIQPTIIDLNLETVKKINAAGGKALFGDAGRREILEVAGLANSKYLLVTLPDLPARIPVIATARMLNPSITILTRARYIGERAMLEESGANEVAYEEGEVAVRLAEKLLREVGAPESSIDVEIEKIRRGLKDGGDSGLKSEKKETPPAEAPA